MLYCGKGDGMLFWVICGVGWWVCWEVMGLFGICWVVGDVFFCVC